MTEYYSAAETEKHKKQEKRLIIIAGALFLAFNAGAVRACIGVNSGNASVRLAAAVLCGTAACVLPVLLYVYRFQPLRALRRHEEGILEEAGKNGTTAGEGVLCDSGHWVALPGSIRYRILTLESDDGKSEIRIPYEKRERLPQNAVRARVSLVRGYLYTLEEIK